MLKQNLIPAAFILIIIIFSGCANTVRYTTSERFALAAPYTVAILPIEWAEDAGEQDNEAAYLFRTMELEKLKGMDYHPVPLEEVDERYLSLGGNFFKERGPKETARLLKADSVLYTRITEWDRDIFVTYAYINVAARFELYSKNGERLWEATYRIKDSDIRLDTKSVELAIVKSYEPKVQRFIDHVFSTLPPGTPPTEKKLFFQWLP